MQNRLVCTSSWLGFLLLLYILFCEIFDLTLRFQPRPAVFSLLRSGSWLGGWFLVLFLSSPQSSIFSFFFWLAHTCPKLNRCR